MASASSGGRGDMTSELARPQIAYVAALRGSGTVLVEYTAVAAVGGWQREVVQVSEKLDEAGAEWKSYCNEQYAFHFTVNVCLSVRFVCAADKAMGRRLPFAFLEAFQQEFNQRFMPQQVADAVPAGMQAAFEDEARSLVERYNSPDQDRASGLTAKVQHINENLMDALDKLVERQEKIDDLVGRSNLLSESSSSFSRQAQEVHRTLSRRGGRRKLIAVAASLLLVAVLVVVVVQSRNHQD